MNNTITDSFNGYFKARYPEGCPKTQEEEIKQAFFAGAFCMFNAVTLIANKYPERAAEKFLTDLNTEVESTIRARIGATLKQN